MSISLLVEKERLANVSVQKLIDELTSDIREFVRVPGMSKSGICPFCAQFVYMVHDGTGSKVPLPVVGTHDHCVCQDIPLPVFKVGTKATLTETFDIPTNYKFPIRKAKSGNVKRFEWLEYQSKRTLAHIIGVTRAGFLDDIPLQRLYDARTKHLRSVKETERIVRKRRSNE